MTVKLATWNVNSLTVRLPQVMDWLSANPVDVLALQETKTTDDRFPHAELQAAGWQAQAFGQKTYNGVALLTPEGAAPPTDIVRNIPGFADDMARVVAATLPDGRGSVMRVIGAYFPNGQAPGSDKFEYKMRWLDALADWIAGELARYPQLVLMGDFNITFDDLDVWDPAGLAGTIHCTREEREQLSRLLGLGLQDTFRLFSQPDKSYSWWDYREFAFRRNRGLRIDHILASAPVAERATACIIDRTPRKNERPSDHAPVMLTLD